MGDNSTNGLSAKMDIALDVLKDHGDKLEDQGKLLVRADERLNRVEKHQEDDSMRLQEKFAAMQASTDGIKDDIRHIRANNEIILSSQKEMQAHCTITHQAEKKRLDTIEGVVLDQRTRIAKHSDEIQPIRETTDQHNLALIELKAKEREQKARESALEEAQTDHEKKVKKHVSLLKWALTVIVGGITATGLTSWGVHCGAETERDKVTPHSAVAAPKRHHIHVEPLPASTSKRSTSLPKLPMSTPKDIGL